MMNVNVAGSESFVARLSKSFEIAREKGVEVPNDINIKEKGNFATISFPIKNDGQSLGNFELTVLKTLSGPELFDLMREDVNKIEDVTSEGYFERNIENKVSFRCIVPGLAFSGILKKEFMKGLIIEGERVANMIHSELEAC